MAMARTQAQLCERGHRRGRHRGRRQTRSRWRAAERPAHARVAARDDLRAAASPPPGRRAYMTGAAAKDPGHPRRLLARTQHRLTPDASRVLGRLFVPGQETLIRGGSRAMAVIDRVLDLTEDE